MGLRSSNQVAVLQPHSRVVTPSTSIQSTTASLPALKIAACREPLYSQSSGIKYERYMRDLHSSIREPTLCSAARKQNSLGNQTPGQKEHFSHYEPPKRCSLQRKRYEVASIGNHSQILSLTLARLASVTSTIPFHHRSRRTLLILYKSQLHTQLAQLSNNLSDTENLLRMTSVQAEAMRGLGSWHGGL